MAPGYRDDEQGDGGDRRPHRGHPQWRQARQYHLIHRPCEAPDENDDDQKDDALATRGPILTSVHTPHYASDKKSFGNELNIGKRG